MQSLNKTQIVAAVMLTTTILLASGCGGSSSSSDGDADSTVVSRGLITGFGSVYVNGIRFHTGGTRFSVDDDSGVESDLRVGMIVTVKGSVDDNGHNGQATHISYDNELKGPVSSITNDPNDATIKTLVILGQSVEVNSNTTIDSDGGLTFANIQLNDVLEVSGFVTESGLVATHIELQDDDLEIEIKGHIENLTINSFTIKGFPVSYDATTELDDIGALVEGLYVEVEGQLNGTGTILLADEIEAEHEGLDDDMDEAEIEGVISGYNDIDKTFTIQEQFIDASNAVFEPTSLVLANGLTVEAEGHVLNGVLLAHKVKQRGKKIKIDATLSEVNTAASTISFSFNSNEIVVRVNHQTEIEDDISDNDIQMGQLSVGDFVEMEAFEDGSGVINAVEIERDSVDEIRIVAPVDGWDENAETVLLLGIVFDLSAAVYENQFDQNISASTFYNSLSPGEFIKIKDTDSNGVFDKAELDD